MATILQERVDPGFDPNSAEKPRVSLEVHALRFVLLLILVASIWSVWALKINIPTIIDSFSNAQQFVANIFPLDWPSFGEVVQQTVLTLSIVFLATLVAVILSVPVAVLAASNTTPNNPTRLISRAFIVIMRAIPDLVLAIVFFRVFGLGALPGILAMGLHSIGMVGKLYADAIESIDPGPGEALRAAGATRTQVVFTSTIPQLMPQIIATGLHRFDINLRTSVILGYVGVAGIGLEISQALNTRNYDSGIAWAIIVLVLCLIVEMISGSARAALLGHNEAKKKGFYGVVAKSLERMRGNRNQGATEATPHEVPRTADGQVRVSREWTADRVRNDLTWILMIVLIVGSFFGAELHTSNPFSNLSNFGNIIGQFFPPSAGGTGDTLWAAMLTTIQIGLAATLLGAIISIPIGIFAAKNVTNNRYVSGFFRNLIVVIRAIPELILAIIFIVITGLGPVPGALALAIGSIGLLSKLLADSIEETDTEVQHALAANGATRSQVFFSATLRQAMPSFAAHIIYQLDTNIRSATLLGIVGAGGIGFYLLNAQRVLAFDVVSYIVIMIIVVTLILEGLSMWIRRVVK